MLVPRDYELYFDYFFQQEENYYGNYDNDYEQEIFTESDDESICLDDYIFTESEYESEYEEEYQTTVYAFISNS